MKITVGQHSDKGRKNINQDFYGVSAPQEPQLSAKGIAIALADGISSSEVSQVAAEFTVMGFLDDYYCTSEAWSVKRSVERVLAATNSWLHSRTQQSPYRDNMDRGYVCTLSALVLKAHTAHVFHVGDARVYRWQGGTLEQLTTDHRVQVSSQQSYLSRAMGFNARLDIDYQALPLDAGDVFVLATDGVHGHVDAATMAQTLAAHRHDLDLAAHEIVRLAFEQGSPDNLTVQIVAVDSLPRHGARELTQQLSQLPLAPIFEARAVVDGYRIVRELHASHRSHTYLAVDVATDTTVVLKTPSVDLHAEPALLERFLLEEWVARRVNSPHVLKPCPPERPRSCLYLVTEYIEGQTLAQWMTDHPKLDVETVRGIVEQIARGLQAFHRLEMLHQDLRPENVMIDRTGTVKIIDFGATRVAGITEMGTPLERGDILGTAQYTAPEYFLGEAGTAQSDQFSLGVIAYQMLSGRLPYGATVARARSASAQRQLRYDSVLAADREIPAWIDDVLRKAVHPDPDKRYEALSEFVHDLRQPTQAFLSRTRAPLVERHPVLFWKVVSGVLAVMVIVLIAARYG
ncbi:bifunctional protein-serine/threonine kinase/phosphatase [Piscinibacter gummiphilus]|uniref:Bifunctional protein-serine/threonine kinase/phosphatase n=1 Tax=Piscinibacter gummiphilus TaxID=946333 RepID=A0ABZ0CWN1_9BURK|nr:bifunctional protein-serine/threonine kinase/phosphatase [Piscinibacter gummiphilus]WOB09379.1 bifunctional protein-serine/threonine kinase/phosphatase [Piscinibacter gummiphilus]